MKWTDIYPIAVYLADHHPDLDPRQIRFSRLRQLILAIPEFNDDPNHGGEKIFEAVQQAWIEESE